MNREARAKVLIIAGVYAVFVSAAALIVLPLISYMPRPILSDPPLDWIAVVCMTLGLAEIAFGIHLKKTDRRTLIRVRGLLKGEGASPREFLSARDALLRNGDFTGIYVIHNATKDMNYVGQSVRVVGRVTQHFTGHGNGDVYADYKYGDDFTINVVSLYESGDESLDALERDAIRAYAAYDCGYNRTRGNGN